MDRGRDATCCRSADPEIVESEPEMFECETCEFRQRVDGLDADNQAAWRLYARMNSHRWLWDMQCGPWWLGELFREMDPDDRDDAMERIDVIHDTLHPPKVRSHGA